VPGDLLLAGCAALLDAARVERDERGRRRARVEERGARRAKARRSSQNHMVVRESERPTDDTTASY
jgi:hypothetical protein